jgi:RES domain-containing protein
MSAVYLADSLALAALELFVHLRESDIDEEFRAFRVSIPESVRIETVRPSELPRSWRTEERQSATRSRGRAWYKKGQSAILRVPSAIVPPEHNFVLNPDHPDYRRIKIGRPMRFVFDTRMWK